MAEDPMNTQPEKQDPDKGGKTYTQEDINRMMAAKAKEVTDALEKKHKEELAKVGKVSEDERKELMAEGAKRAQMTADQKAKAEFEDRKKALEQQKAEFDKTMAEFRNKQALSDTKDALIDAGLPKDFANFLSSTDEEERTNNVKGFSDLFKKAVDDAVDKRLQGKKNPQDGKTAPAKSDLNVPKTAGEFWNLSQPEQAQLLKSDPELRNKLHLF